MKFTVIALITAFVVSVTATPLGSGNLIDFCRSDEECPKGQKCQSYGNFGLCDYA
ncbi:hypothetical protein QVD99_001572 [Batrachochytrium dendrobatidis]|nr:hypothetical protein QVD99_001572 [Batrachochytrium dendrobatidis]